MKMKMKNCLYLIKVIASSMHPLYIVPGIHFRILVLFSEEKCGKQTQLFLSEIVNQHYAKIT